jgi:acetaldehyde dehydrogenase (acetylating)
VSEALQEPVAPAERELFVRHARRGGRSIAILRAVDRGVDCIVYAEVFPVDSMTSVQAGPYTFANAAEASAFVTEAVEALMYLGCDVHAQ